MRAKSRKRKDLTIEKSSTEPVYFCRRSYATRVINGNRIPHLLFNYDVDVENDSMGLCSLGITTDNKSQRWHMQYSRGLNDEKFNWSLAFVDYISNLENAYLNIVCICIQIHYDNIFRHSFIFKET